MQHDAASDPPPPEGSGTIIKKCRTVRLRFALAYPNTLFCRHVLGLQTMYRVINQRPDTV